MSSLRFFISNNIGSIYMLLFLHHLYVILVYLLSIDAINNSTDPAIITMKKYGPHYYTVWNFTLQVIYLVVVLITHFWPKQQQEIGTLLKQIKGYMFVTFVGPCAVFTITSFWTVYIIDRDLVCPIQFDLLFSSYLKHATHTMVFLLFIAEMILADHVVPKLKDSFLGFVIFHTLYYVMFFGTYFINGDWIYKLYEVISWTTRISIVAYENISSLIIMLVITRYERTQAELRQKSY